jgi:predicted ester cyclase
VGSSGGDFRALRSRRSRRAHGVRSSAQPRVVRASPLAAQLVGWGVDGRDGWNVTVVDVSQVALDLKGDRHWSHGERGLMSEQDSNKDVYRRVIATVSDGNVEALNTLLAPDMVDHNPVPGQSPGSSGFAEWMTSARSSFTDFHGTVEAVVAEGTLVAGRVTWSGTHNGPFLGLAPTGRAVDITAFHLVRFASERVVEWWGTADLLGTLLVLGGRVVSEPLSSDSS